MNLSGDVSSALQLLFDIQNTVDEIYEKDSKPQLVIQNDLQKLISLLDNPIVRNIVNIQDALVDLNKQYIQHPSILPIDFDITSTGKLLLSSTNDLVTSVLDYSDNLDYDDGTSRVVNSAGGPASLTAAVSSSSSDYNGNIAMSVAAAASAAQAGDDDVDVHNNRHHYATSSNRGCYRFASQTIDRRTPQQQHGSVIVAGVQNDDEEISSHRMTTTTSTSFLSDVSNTNTNTTASNSATTNTPTTESIFYSKWAEVEIIELINDGPGLGFGIISGKCSGVIVKTILHNGVAHRDKRLKSGDYILQINEINLHEMTSEQVAAVLKHSGRCVKLIVARPANPLSNTFHLSNTRMFVPSKMLYKPAELNSYLSSQGYSEIFDASDECDRFKRRLSSCGSRRSLGGSSVTSFTPPTLPLAHQQLQPSETEILFVELAKDRNKGLGITIAGYVCEKEALSGIFVKNIAKGSAADLSNRIKINDRIIQVDNIPLQDCSNNEAVEILRNSGNPVVLCLERYLYGPKYEQLKNYEFLEDEAEQVVLEHQDMNMNYHHHQQQQQQQQLQQLESYGSEMSHESGPSDEMNESAFPLPPPPLELLQTSSSSGFKIACGGSTTSCSSSGRGGGRGRISGSSSSSSLSSALPPPPPPLPVSPNDTTTSSDDFELIEKWRTFFDDDDDNIEIVVAHIQKFNESSGLGISLEGTVDVEFGKEIRPHHYIRSILPEGPTGLNGTLRAHDELLEVNDRRLMGLNHLEVVSILKELPLHVRMVCGRNRAAAAENAEEAAAAAAATASLIALSEENSDLSSMTSSSAPTTPSKNSGDLGRVSAFAGKPLPPTPSPLSSSLSSSSSSSTTAAPAASSGNNSGCTAEDKRKATTSTQSSAYDRLVKAKSDGSLATSASAFVAIDTFSKMKSRSLEPLTSLAMWSSDIQVIELTKSDRGLGFSILDYQDPIDAHNTVIVIRSLVPGGVAQMDGRLIPGDRLIFVNETDLKNASLDQAVQVLKGAAKGIVRIGVAKPLPLSSDSTHFYRDDFIYKPSSPIHLSQLSSSE